MCGYITKEQALEIAKRTSGDYAQAFSEISRLPPADVAPVVYGYWRFCGEDGHGYGLWRCTYCGNVVPEKAAKYFCPHCGARMGGGKSK